MTIGFGGTELANSYWWNLGGWGNTQQGVEKQAFPVAGSFICKLPPQSFTVTPMKTRIQLSGEVSEKKVNA